MLSSAACSNILYAVVILVLFALVVGLSMWGASMRVPKPSKGFEQRIRTLLDEAKRWSGTAAQDTNLLLALQHANFGVAYLNVARALASDADIERICNLRLDELATRLLDVQQAVVYNASSQCQALASPGVDAARTGWIVL